MQVPAPIIPRTFGASGGLWAFEAFGAFGSFGAFGASGASDLQMLKVSLCGFWDFGVFEVAGFSDFGICFCGSDSEAGAMRKEGSPRTTETPWGCSPLYSQLQKKLGGGTVIPISDCQV